MTELAGTVATPRGARPRLPSFVTFSVLAHAFLVGSVSAAASGVRPRAISTVRPSVMIPFETERPRPPPVVQPPAPQPPAARVPPPSPRPSPRVSRAPRPTAPTPPAPAPPTPAPPTPAPAPAPPALITAAGGHESVASAPAGGPSSTGRTAGGTSTSPTATGNTPGADGAAAEGPFNAGPYLALVEARVRSHTVYPAMAIQLGQEGTVRVRVTVNPNGSLAGSPRIEESSGSDILDDEALRIVARSAPFPPIAGRRTAVRICFPVRFHLDD